jgi:APA family basic amino acid/polyamine antiporter
MEPTSTATVKPTTNGSAATDSSPGLVRGLSLLDSVLLLAGGIIGSSIFLTAKDIAGPLPHPALFFLVWVIGAMISMCAAFAFTELGSMFPDSGGQYIYLRRPLEPRCLSGRRMLFAVANGGTIAALSVASAAYLGAIFPAISEQHVIVSVAGITLTRVHVVALISIVIVTWINVIGLRRGAVLQNVATWAKFVAMGTFVLHKSCLARELGFHATRRRLVCRHDDGHERGTLV